MGLGLDEAVMRENSDFLIQSLESLGLYTRKESCAIKTLCLMLKVSRFCVPESHFQKTCLQWNTHYHPLGICRRHYNTCIKLLKIEVRYKYASQPPQKFTSKWLI